MVLPAGKGVSVEYARGENAGMPWIVRTYEKKFLMRRVISSDWFLDPEQAKRFAETLAAELRNGASLAAIRGRKPGWTLHRPSR